MYRSLLLVAVLLVAFFVSGSSQGSEIVALLDTGTLVSTRDGEVTLAESFTFSELNDGSYKLVSSFVDLNSQVKAQDLTLNENFLPTYYTRRQSSPVEDERVTVAEFIEDRAIVTITSPDDVERMTFNTATEFNVFDIDSVSHITSFLHRLAHLGGDSYAFDALFAENLDVVPSEFRRVGAISFSSGGQQFEADEYAWDIGGGAQILRVIAHGTQLVGAIQTRNDGALDIIYRADIYPAGIEL